MIVVTPGHPRARPFTWDVYLLACAILLGAVTSMLDYGVPIWWALIAIVAVVFLIVVLRLAIDVLWERAGTPPPDPDEEPAPFGDGSP